MAVSTDNLETPERTAARELYEFLGIVPAPVMGNFRCPSLSECSRQCRDRGERFNTGTWPYIGAEYGQAVIKSCRVRILFVAMERGGSHDPSYEPAFKDTQNSFRTAAEKRTNPHMGGVAAIMKHLVDEIEPLRYSQQFALTNAVKCVEYTESMNSLSTPEMIRNCKSHLRAEIEALNPDLVITQGTHPRHTVCQILEPLSSVADFADEAGRTKATILAAGSRLILTTPHPARLKGLGWKSGGLPAFLNAAVQKARDEFVTLAARSS
jgi:uracil-DNA glycosylase